MAIEELTSLISDQTFGIWFLIGAALVFWMQAGFAMVETGFVRAKNAGNIIMKNLMDFCIGTVVFIVIGFSLLLGEDLLGFNPLKASIEVKLKADYAHPDSLQWIERGLNKGTTAIDEIVYQKDLLKMVNDNIRRIGLILLCLAIVLMIISFALISNTIRLTAYSKRFIIHTMKLVGATPGFIRKPFILSNIVNGIIAAFVAIGMLTGCVYYLMSEIDNFYTLVSIQSLMMVYVIVLLLGITITAISSYFAVNRYIRMDRDDLYYV